MDGGRGGRKWTSAVHRIMKPTLPPKAWDLRQAVGLQWKMDSRLRGNDKKRREGHRRAGMTRKV